jgi:hypothetical protein
LDLRLLLFFGPNIIRIIKSKEDEMGRTCSVGEMRTEFWLGSLKERAHSENLGVDGRIILK